MEYEFGSSALDDELAHYFDVGADLLRRRSCPLHFSMAALC
jgi:hypothetical protein